MGAKQSRVATMQNQLPWYATRWDAAFLSAPANFNNKIILVAVEVLRCQFVTRAIIAQVQATESRAHPGSIAAIMASRNVWNVQAKANFLLPALCRAARYKMDTTLFPSFRTCVTENSCVPPVISVEREL